MINKKEEKKIVKKEEKATRTKKEVKRPEKIDSKAKGTVFRKGSLERLSSPEHLDKMITITDSKGWLALGSMMFLISIIVVWGFVGALPTKVSGSGILIKSGGIKAVQHSTSGTITDISISVGDQVEKGEVIARLGVSSTLTQISNSMFELKSMKEQKERYLEYFAKNESLKRSYFEDSKATHEEMLRDLDRDIQDQKRIIVSERELLEKGGISREDLKISIQKLDALESNRDNINNTLKQIHMEEISFKKQHEDQLIALSNSIKEKESEILYLQDVLDHSSKIVSPYSGRVVSSFIDKGTIISAGQELLRVEVSGKSVRNLEAVIFVPAEVAKKIEIGMEAQISPSTVNPSQYGVILGMVTAIDDYPSSYQSISNLLGDELARTYSQISDPIKVIVNLIPEDNYSGFRWSSKRGPEIKISTGTPASAEIKIKEQRPITIVFPSLSSLLNE